MCRVFQVSKVVKKPLHFDPFTASPFIRLPKFVPPSGGSYAPRSRIRKSIEPPIFQVFKKFITNGLNQVNEMRIGDKLRFLGLLLSAAQMVRANIGATELLSTAKSLDGEVGRMSEDLKEIKNLLRNQAKEAKASRPMEDLKEIRNLLREAEARRATPWWKIW